MTTPLSSTNMPNSFLFDTNEPLYATTGASQSNILQPKNGRITSARQSATSPFSFHPSSKQDSLFSAFSSSISTTNTEPAGSHIAMSLCDQIFTFNLQCLEPDPREIIELLKLTASDKGNWALVGLHYRRVGNPSAAITVITTMVKEMTRHQIPDTHLKPAFLFLASCETELSKQTKQDDATSTAQHRQNAQKWLQKVYGIFSDSIVESSKPPVPFARQPSLPKKTKNKPQNHSLSVPRLHAELPPRPQNVYQKILEREIGSLRDRQAVQASILSEVRSCKRQLEDDITYERETRRRMERELDTLRRERDSARRSEAYAVEQMMKETETRRRMEEIVDRERQLRRETEGRLYISEHGHLNLSLDA
ncbi:uncharacterized protein BT62DRAFT_1075818 [Guyanagaster necrorhizus]|uniref:Uncharacterized protein n=1 Tax=Guyanagaster necrorhizus TaxID=856835 RepID=A0A9P8ASK4_9AGAR|nr:uncharacterized protein BT62DRAFT_1075818 [Guyanagaster necrorhizus MCA 3950]KAG7446225.1 hypothetical protein BT62DRAFT_1075818 [Guyanagaster necrorhizus MCA 3950]